MKHPLKIAALLAGLAVVSALTAKANIITFDLQYTGDNGDDGSGQVTATEISPGTYLATSGTFTLSAGPYNPYTSSLVTIPNSGTPGQAYDSEMYGGTVITYDDLIVQNPSAPGGYTTTYAGGLLFNNPAYAFPDGATGMAFYLSQISPGNPAQTYSFWSGGAHNEAYQEETGVLTITAMPDSGATAALLGLGLMTLGLFRRTVKNSSPVAL